MQRSYKPPQRQWCFHEFFSHSVLKKEEAACAWSFKTDMMWILRVQTCSSGARALAAVWQYQLWSFEFWDTKSKMFFGFNREHKSIYVSGVLAWPLDILIETDWMIKMSSNHAITRPVIPGGAGAAMPPPPPNPQILADQLTLCQPRGTEYAHQIILAPPDFQTSRQP